MDPPAPLLHDPSWSVSDQALEWQKTRVLQYGARSRRHITKIHLSLTPHLFQKRLSVETVTVSIHRLYRNWSLKPDAGARLPTV